jgi:GDYXXLXY protein
MSALRLALFSLVALAEIALPAHSIFMRTQTLAKGRLWKLRAAPIDPVDALRGRYVTLAFVAETVPQSETLPRQSEAYAILKETPDGFAVVDRLSPTPVSGDNVIKVTVSGYWSGAQRVEFPFSRFWLDEKTASAAEQAYATNSRREKQNAYATIRVRDGDAALEQLYIGDLPLADYLRRNPAP